MMNVTELKNAILVTAIPAFATACAILLVQEYGDYRILDTITPFIVLIVGFLIIRRGKERIPKLLFVAIVLSFFVYKLSISIIRISIPELFIIIIFFLIRFLILNRQLFVKYTRAEKYVLLFCFLYVIGGLLTSLYNHINLDYWLTSCVIPFLILFNVFSIISTVKQADNSLLAACLSMYCFLFFNVFAFIAGFARELYNPGSGVLTAVVNFEKLKYVIYGNWLGATCAMIFPLFFISSIFEGNFKKRIFHILGTVLSIYFLFRSGTRGPAIGLVVGVLLVLSFILLRQKKSITIGVRLVQIGLIIVILSASLIYNISSDVQGKFTSMFQERSETPNIQLRIRLMSDAYGSLLTNPLGIGFSKLWEEYNIDEANFFSWSANGIGLLGVIGFWGFCIAILFNLTKGLYNSNNIVRYYSIIGISTLFSTFISANSSDQILREPQTLICFWFIIGVCFKAVSMPEWSMPVNSIASERTNLGEIQTKRSNLSRWRLR